MNTLQKYEKYFYIIFVVGILIYFPIFFNGFVWDDYPYILNNPQIHLFDFASIFGPSYFNFGFFYRPIPDLYFTILYSFSGQHAFLYHLVQLVLHITSSVLLFIFFLFFFSDSIAFFLTLIFLVHPINVESVAFIGATQSELFFLPGIIALLLSQKKVVSQQRFLWIIVLLFLSALTKETGILFFLLVVIYRYVFKLGKLKDFLVASVVCGFIYLLLRDVVGGVKFDSGFLLPKIIATFPLILLNIPPIIFYYLKTFLYPSYLAIWQSWTITTPTFSNFVISLLACLLLLVLVVVFSLYLNGYNKKEVSVVQKKKKTKNTIQTQKNVLDQFIFFSIWFIIGIAILLQIPPLEMTVADRWFYFPIVGLLGMIGVVFEVFIPQIKVNYKVYLYVAIIIIILLSIRSFIRTFDYKDNLTLYAHDSVNQVNDMYLMNAYVTELKNDNNINEEIQYLQSIISFQDSTLNQKITAYDYLGLAYEVKNEDSQAISSFEQAITLYTKNPNDINSSFAQIIYNNLVNVLNYDSRYKDILTIVTGNTLKRFPYDACLFGNVAIAQYNLGNQQSAIDYASIAYKISHIKETEIIPPNPVITKMCSAN